TVKGSALAIGGIQVQPCETVKFLGVTLNGTLRWNHHVNKALEKGQNWINNFSRLAKGTSGIPPIIMRQLYLSIAVPQMLYAADIFLTSNTQGKHLAPTKKPRGKPAIYSKLAAIQRKAMIAILGAYRSTPNTMLNAMANLLPFHLLVDVVRQRAAIRLATLNAGHLLKPWVAKAATRYIMRHPVPLHKLMFTYGIQPKRMEVTPSTTSMWYTITEAQVVIAGSKEMAIRDDRRDMNIVKIYTDGLRMEGVGVAVVIYRRNREIKHL
ncbi:hypothetical protein AX17_006892, partial [Amanita inopinata Kibby_2008]